MKIQSNFTVDEVQKQFQKQYPLLKVEFYKVAHTDFSGSFQKDQVAPDERLSSLSPKQDGEIRLSDEMTVRQLEGELESRFGLHVQVFRRSGESWLQTSATDGWSLAKHMESAQNSLKTFPDGE